VLFPGAGVSSAAPACLPGWYALNDAILQALFDRIGGVEALNAEQRAGAGLLWPLGQRNGSEYSFGICLNFPFYEVGQNAIVGFPLVQKELFELNSGNLPQISFFIVGQNGFEKGQALRNP